MYFQEATHSESQIWLWLTDREQVTWCNKTAILWALVLWLKLAYTAISGDEDVHRRISGKEKLKYCNENLPQGNFDNHNSHFIPFHAETHVTSNLATKSLNIKLKHKRLNTHPTYELLLKEKPSFYRTRNATTIVGSWNMNYVLGSGPFKIRPNSQNAVRSRRSFTVGRTKRNMTWQLTANRFRIWERVNVYK